MAIELQLAATTPGPQPITVILADDHRLVRKALRSVLEHEHDVEVIAETADLSSTVRLVSSRAPDVLSLDLQMPNGSSIELIGRLRRQVPRMEIVVVTMHSSPVFARAALDAGACGYVLKSHAATDLPLAIRAAARGRRYLTRAIAARLHALQQSPDGDR